MQNYAPDSDIPVTFALRNEAGDALEPVSLSWRVLDEDDQELQAWTSLTAQDPPQDELTLTIPAIYTSLAEGQLRGIRSVELKILAGASTIILSEQVLLQTLTALRAGVNSFGTYSRALLACETCTEQSLIGWRRESRREEHERALLESYRAILQLPLYMKTGVALVVALKHKVPVDAEMMTALQLAQVLEASEILNADPTITARRNGLMSMSVGESSQFFGTAKPLDLPVMSKLALKALSPWINNAVRIGRA